MTKGVQMAKPVRGKLSVIYAILIASLGSFQSSYNAAVVSGAMSFFSKEFSLTSTLESFAISIILIGAFFGAYGGGKCAQTLGRKKSILTTGLCSFIGTILVVTAFTPLQFCVGRFIQGLAIGGISVVGPMYTAELAPPEKRGTYLIVAGLVGATGIFASYGFNYLFSSMHNWRLMFGITLIPAVFQVIGCCFIPESPAWSKSNRQEESSWSSLLSLKYRKMIKVGVLMHFFQQAIGINTIIYFTPYILEQLCPGTVLATPKSAMLATFGIGIVGFMATAVACKLVDKLGRRPLLLMGIPGMGLSLISIISGAYFKVPHFEIIAVVCLASYIIFFSLSMSQIPWLLISEIYPSNIRGKAMSLSTLVNWSSNYLVTLSFLPLIGVLGINGTFGVFIFFIALAFLFALRQIPETKGKTLQEIEQLF
jgi:SP family galactose:H+ symporter-like MFS transporter